MKVPELLADPWAMAPGTFEILVDCARRGMTMREAKAASMGLTPEGLTYLIENARDDDPIDVREGGVAVIPVRGYLTRRAYWRGDRASYEWIGGQIEAAIERYDVQRIVLEVDSPGGQVNGTAELSEQIFDARSQKPIVAYVLGQAASAAYYIASSAERIVAGRQSMLGSIGVIWTFTDWSKYDERIGLQEISIVSSQSPDKDLDPSTAEGRALVQTTVDQLAGTFVADVSRNRNVSEEKVISDFGGGWVLVGEMAVEAGLADELGRFEQAITEADPDATSSGPQPNSVGKDDQMETINVSDITAEWLQANCPDAVVILREGFTPNAEIQTLRDQVEAATTAAEAATTAGATAERERILGIEAATKGAGQEELTATCKADPECSVKDAQARLFEAAQGQRSSALDALKKDEQGLDAPAPTGGGQDDTAADAARIKSAGDYVQATGALR